LANGGGSFLYDAPSKVTPHYEVRFS